MDERVEEFFASAGVWGEEMRTLRAAVTSTGLAEEWKWSQPCYTHDGKNVAMISAFSRHCSLSFFRGVLLTDPDGLLTTPGKDSQSARQFRFTSTDQVEEHVDAIRTFIAEAVAQVEARTRVAFPARDELELPAELVERFADVEGLEAAFRALTPGRQRGYVLQIEGAKRAVTRRARVDKHIVRILAGRGIHDCVCGQTARPPRCDGSHSR